MRKIFDTSIHKSKEEKFEYSLEFLLYNYMKNINPLSQKI